MVKAENTVKKISQKNLCSVQHFRSLACIYGAGQKQPPERAHMKGRFIMKKTISLMLALASISSMGVSAMAANDTDEPMVIAPAPSVGHPIIGDPVYGLKKDRFSDIGGQCLHAAELTLTHPKTGERMTFSAALPDYFVEILQKLERMQ